MTTTVSEQRVHLSGYQARDFEVIDYRMAELPGTGLMMRGPLPESLDGGQYFACVGAAQTFGCFCEHPYPALVSEALGIPALNLGYGGAGPEFFLKQDALLPYLQRARFVILQVMSARSQSNSFYDCDGLEYVRIRGDGRKMGAGAAFDELVKGPRSIRALPLPKPVTRRAAWAIGLPRTRAVVSEIRSAWVASNRALIERINVPVVLFWFSKRTPGYRASYRSQRGLFGEFPHLVTPEMVASVRRHATAYVESVSSRGSPQPLFSRFTGAPVTVSPALDRADLESPPWHENRYYPSPEMHEDAARRLLESGALPVHGSGR